MKGVNEKLLNFDFVINLPNDTLKGQWRRLFEQGSDKVRDHQGDANAVLNPTSETSPTTAEPLLFVELGCGKGDFISTIASLYPNVCFVGIELEPTVLFAAARKVHALNLHNVRLAVANVSHIDHLFSLHEVDRLFINFCDPWPRNKHAKRRLTNINFLNMYHYILKPNSQLHFKTDNRTLFDYSLEQFNLLQLHVDHISFDLHADKPPDNILTEYERKFSALGSTINRCVVHF